MSLVFSGTNGVTFPDSSLQTAAASPYVLKNRIINGDFRIDQRNAGASVTPANGAYTIDRWFVEASQASKFTVQQNAGSVTPPAGFTNYLGITVGASANVTVGTSDYFDVTQAIEGFNVADLDFGKSTAKTITFSFWVRSSLTGTFGGSIRNGSAARSYPFTYTISSTNTWEQKTITVVGDTSGTWLTTNGIGLSLCFSLGMGSTYSGTAGAWATANYASATGSTNLISTNSATFYITGVQLEQNTSATPFERRLYNQELANCQRYCYKDGGDIANQYSNTPGGYYDANYLTFGLLRFPVTMRSQPSLTQYGTPVVYQTASQVSTTMTSWNITISGNPSNQFCYLNTNKTSHGITPSILYVVRYPTTSDYFIFSSEL
jgi:hypothetical protein